MRFEGSEEDLGDQQLQMDLDLSFHAIMQAEIATATVVITAVACKRAEITDNELGIMRDDWICL